MPGASRTALTLPRLIALALAASLLPVRPAVAQVYRFDRVTAASGLPNDAVFGLFQDSRGYLWIATENGVCRHDGVGCSRLGVREGLVAPVARDVLEDREGRIWIATEGGLSRWDGHGFTNFTKASAYVAQSASAAKRPPLPLPGSSLVGLVPSFFLMRSAMSSGFSSDNNRIFSLPFASS